MVDHKNAALKRIHPGMRQAMKYDQTLLINKAAQHHSTQGE